MNLRRFLLVGNGAYQNRGCEAIVRGTLEILRRTFDHEIMVNAEVFASEEVIAAQNLNETDAVLRSYSLHPPSIAPRLSAKWWASQLNNRLGCRFAPERWELGTLARNSELALEIGGDNYSLDYGRPERFLELDRFLQARNLPVILWGASVGPFEADPKFAPQMLAHLCSLDGIFVRETDSLDYLRSKGVCDNLHLMADPAFVMPPVEPSMQKVGPGLPTNAIGINLSPMAGKYRGAKGESCDLTEWKSLCVAAVREIASLGQPIILVPHVQSDYEDNDDFRFLREIHQSIQGEFPEQVALVPTGLSAAELKWIISRCSIFAGARTHATIAAISSCVPTLSIGYSVKANGINRDVFGNLDHCLPVKDLTCENFKERVQTILSNRAQIRDQLTVIVPQMQDRAYQAGVHLRDIMTAALPK